MRKAASDPPTVKMKICLVGDFAVGKTSLVRRFVHHAFEENYLATMGAEVTKKELMVNALGRERVRIVMVIWDIMGHTGIRDLVTDAYFKGAQGMLVVGDLTRRETFSNLAGRRKAVQNLAGRVPAYVAANKADLEEERAMTSAGVRTVCEPWDWPFRLTSAKTGDGVEAAFRGLADLVMKSPAFRRSSRTRSQ